MSWIELSDLKTVKNKKENLTISTANRIRGASKFKKFYLTFNISSSLLHGLDWKDTTDLKSKWGINENKGKLIIYRPKELNSSTVKFTTISTGAGRLSINAVPTSTDLEITRKEVKVEYIIRNNESISPHAYLEIILPNDFYKVMLREINNNEPIIKETVSKTAVVVKTEGTDTEFNNLMKTGGNISDTNLCKYIRRVFGDDCYHDADEGFFVLNDIKVQRYVLLDKANIHRKGLKQPLFR